MKGYFMRYAFSIELLAKHSYCILLITWYAQRVLGVGSGNWIHFGSEQWPRYFGLIGSCHDIQKHCWLIHETLLLFHVSGQLVISWFRDFRETAHVTVIVGFSIGRSKLWVL